MTEKKTNMRREQCTRCAIKHLGQARALMLEVKKGYPEHVWYALGHMAEAEDEIVEIQPEAAEVIRTARVKIEKELSESTLEMKYLGTPPDWKSLMQIVAHDGMLEEVL